MIPIGDGIWRLELPDGPPRTLCTDCGISRTDDPGRCGRACQFIKPDYTSAEHRIHGRARDVASEDSDEALFGCVLEMWQARLTPARAGAQWTGITTRIAERLLETGAVDAVLCVAPHPDDAWRPMPVIVTKPQALAQCRGMRMGYAPLTALIEPAVAAGHSRIAMVGIPCQVYAARALEHELGLDALYVIGTPCSDNTTTENFHGFLARLTDRPQDVTYLEFRADYHVELRFADGKRRDIPFLMLPIADLPGDFFPLTCRTCVDYTNALADITVGYMGGSGEQWLIVRNARGRELLDLVRDELVLTTPASKGKRTGAVTGFLANTERAAGGLPLRRMPKWLRPIVGRLMPIVGPKGLEFARARVEMKAIETVLHLRRNTPAKMRNMIPPHVWRAAARYGLSPDKDERAETESQETKTEPPPR